MSLRRREEHKASLRASVLAVLTMGIFMHVILTFIILLETESSAVGQILTHAYYDYLVTLPSNKSLELWTWQQTNSRTTMASKVPNVTDCLSDTTTNYEGKQNITRSKQTCLRWDSSLIPINERFQDTDFPIDGSVQQANNFCRDPNNSGVLWCYTTNPDVTTDTCSIDKCEQTEITSFMAEFEDDVWRCGFPTRDCKGDEQLVCYDPYTAYTTTFKEDDCLMYFCCYKRGCIDVPSSEYAGRWSHSIDLSECLRWDTITDISLNASSFPEGSIAEANNYCRDPENQGLPYCFVQGARRYCGIPTCSELASRHKYSHDCYKPSSSDSTGLDLGVTENELCLLDPDRIVIDSDELRDKYPGCRECSCCQIQRCYLGESQYYDGTWSRTKSGRECRSWVELDSLIYTDYYGNTPSNSENYCRDFLWYGYTYCYTKDLNIGFEECNLKIECSDNSPKPTLIWNELKFSTVFNMGVPSQVNPDHTNPGVPQTTSRRGHIASEITTQKPQPSTKGTFAGYSNTSESRVEQNETTEWPPSTAPAKLTTMSFLLSLTLSLHLF